MSLDLIKKHLHLDIAFMTDDVILIQYMEAAETFITNYLHHNFDPLNKTHIQAQLLLTGSYYLNRENEILLNFSEAPFGVKALLDMDMHIAI